MQFFNEELLKMDDLKTAEYYLHELTDEYLILEINYWIEITFF